MTEVVGAPNPGIYDWRLSPYTIDLARRAGRAARGDARLRLADRLRPARGRARARRWPTSSTARSTRRSGARSTPASSSASPPTTACAPRPTPTAAPTSASSTTRSAAAGVRGAPHAVPDHRPLRRPPRRARLAGLGRISTTSSELDRARGALAALPGVEAVLDRVRRRPTRSSCPPTGSATSSCSPTRARCSASRAPPTTSARSTARCARTAACTSAPSR